MKTIATAPDAIAYLQELKRHGWEDPHFCLPEDAKPASIKIDFGGLSDEFAALIAERRESVA
jgi:hypothetical protein